MRVLGIETSCDETGVAIYDSDQGLMANCLYSQVAKHAEFGGVVPELASRDHVRKIALLTKQALQEANACKKSIDAIVYTQGPGLIGALLVGATFAKSLGFTLNIPTLGLHHLEAHLMAPMLESPAPSFPFIALLVSGGHTQLLSVEALGQYTLLGETLDDAVGEAFDKTAKLMGLAYPGGPKLAKLAENGDRQRFKLPRPMTDRPGIDMSFSGLKTQVLVTWQKSDQSAQTKADLAASFEQAICDTLSIKCRRAMEKTGISNLVVSGGVSANLTLRNALSQLTASQGGQAYFPRPALCTDNGAMVAYLGWLYLSQGLKPAESALAIQAKARWPIFES